jgi:hypothetical protein
MRIPAGITAFSRLEDGFSMIGSFYRVWNTFADQFVPEIQVIN